MHAYSQPMTPAPRTVSDSGQPIELEDRVAVVDVAIVEGDLRGLKRRDPVAMRKNSPVMRALPVGRRPRACARRRSFRRLERSRPCGARGSSGCARPPSDAPSRAGHEPRHRVRAVELHLDAVELALVVAGEEERGLAQRLRRQGAGVHAGATWLRCDLDDRDPLAEVGRLGRALFTGGAAAHHHQIVVVGHSFAS